MSVIERCERDKGLWTKAEYDRCPELAGRLHSCILDLEAKVERLSTTSAGAVEALQEAGALAANIRVGWGKTLQRDVKDCLRRIEDLARLGGR
jgi:hypothetical protein